MSKRLQEISRQALDYAFEICNQSGHTNLNSNVALTLAMSKQAELIVRECINIAYEYDKPKLSGPGLAIASNIESHFDIYIEEDGRFVK